MEDKARAAVWGGFVADSLALGAHWIYDVDRIDQEIGRVDRLMDPPKGSYHAGRAKGDLTHYGDQMRVLLESVSATGTYDQIHFFTAWKQLFSEYDGYVDRATRDTLGNIESGNPPEAAGSASGDLSGASRVAALSYHYRNDSTGFVVAARSQTAMTHNHPQVIESAEFFAQLISGVVSGGKPAATIAAIRRRLPPDSRLGKWIDHGLDSAGVDTRSAIRKFGQMCDVTAGFPCVIHLIARYENHLREALIENVMAGGDSAARGILVGAILGADAGTGGIPGDWVTGLRGYERIRDLIR
ncbi:MAG: ADP-ribosylglycohydrolase family protein [Desulfobacterales bacterium]